MAILKFRIYLEEDDAVYRDVVIKHTQSFQDLHFAILKAYEFDSKHKATFFRSNDNWQRGREISFEKHWIFLVELINVSKEESSKITYPSVSRVEGIGPQQYGTKSLLGDKFADIEEKYDLSEAAEGFGTEGANEGANEDNFAEDTGEDEY